MSVKNVPEEWRPVVGFEGAYEVSTLGQVRTVPRVDAYGRRHRQQVLKATPNNGGHLYVKLSQGNRKTKRYVHRMVLEAFVGPCPAGMEGCHTDGDETNNRLTNLRWDTRAGNIQDSVRHGTHAMTAKTHCPYDHPLTQPNLTPWGAGRGCLACARARDRVGHKGRTDFKAEADKAFQEIWTKK